MDETTGTGPEPSEAPITPSGGADVESDEANVDAGGKAHTSSTEEHPAGDGERTDRDVGGPKTGD